MLTRKQWIFAIVTTAVLLASGIGFVAASSSTPPPQPAPGTPGPEFWPNVNLNSIDCGTPLGPVRTNGSLSVSMFTTASPKVGSFVCFELKVHNIGTGEQVLPSVITITVTGAVKEQLYMPIMPHASIILPGKTWTGSIYWDTRATGITSGSYHVQASVGYITTSSDLVLNPT